MNCARRVHGVFMVPYQNLQKKLASDNATLKLLDGILPYTLIQTAAHHASSDL